MSREADMSHADTTQGNGPLTDLDRTLSAAAETGKRADVAVATDSLDPVLRGRRLL
jgi:hypothetical protein